MSQLNCYLNLGILGEDVECVVRYNYKPPCTVVGVGYDERVQITDVVIQGVVLSPHRLSDLIAELQWDGDLLDKISREEARK